MLVKCRGSSNAGVEGGEEGDGKGKEKGKGNGDGYELKDVFEGTLPVPMVIPGEEYGGRKPWYFMGDA